MKKGTFWIVLLFSALIGSGIGIGLSGCKEVKTGANSATSHATSQPSSQPSGSTSQPASSQPASSQPASR